MRTVNTVKMILRVENRFWNLATLILDTKEPQLV